MSKHTDTSRIGDLVGRLRRTYPDYYNPARASTGTAISPASMLLVRERLLNPDGPEAADRIEALEAENERLRERVKQLNEGWNAMGIKGQAIIDRLRAENDKLREALNQALLHRYGDWTDIVRAALGEKQ